MATENTTAQVQTPSSLSWQVGSLDEVRGFVSGMVLYMPEGAAKPSAAWKDQLPKDATQLGPVEAYINAVDMAYRENGTNLMSSIRMFGFFVVNVTLQADRVTYRCDPYIPQK